MAPDSGYPSYSRHLYSALAYLSGWQPFGVAGLWQDGFGILRFTGAAIQPGGPFALPSDIASIPNPADGQARRFAVVSSGQFGVVDVVPGAGSAALRYAIGTQGPGTTVYLDQISYPV